jgi:hypothetical protein
MPKPPAVVAAAVLLFLVSACALPGPGETVPTADEQQTSEQEEQAEDGLDVAQQPEAVWTEVAGNDDARGTIDRFFLPAAWNPTVRLGNCDPDRSLDQSAQGHPPD